MRICNVLLNFFVSVYIMPYIFAFELESAYSIYLIVCVNI